MIKANELKIGNYVKDAVSGEVMVVDELGENIGAVLLNRDKYPLPDGWQMAYIPLTPGILEKAGFQKRVDRFKSEYLGLSIDNGIDKAELIFYPDGDSKSVALFSRGSMIGFNQYYLHQVQNIYFDLTGGKELTINFKDLTYQ